MSIVKFFKGNNYSNSVQSLLRNIGNRNITGTTVKRVPLSSTLNFLLDLTSKGEFDQKLNDLGYDSFYHLFLVISIGSSKYVLEKNEVISLKSMSKLPPKTESLIVEVNNPVTLNQLLDNPKAVMKERFFVYDARENNCQFFLFSVLNANNLGDDIDKTFITQDTEYLFENNPQFRKLVNRITDTGAIVDNVKNNLTLFSPVLTPQKYAFSASNYLLRPQERGTIVLFPFSKLW